MIAGNPGMPAVPLVLEWQWDRKVGCEGKDEREKRRKVIEL